MHLPTASVESEQLKMELKIEDLLSVAIFCQDLQLFKGFAREGLPPH